MYSLEMFGHVILKNKQVHLTAMWIIKKGLTEWGTVQSLIKLPFLLLVCSVY